MSASIPPHTEPQTHRPNGWWARHATSLGALGLLLLTALAMTLLWRWPQATLMHFWLIAQFVPLLYWLLVWALLGAHNRRGDVD